MTVPRVWCIVPAGGRGSRLGPLTTGRAKPSLPVGGNYRLIDVSRSTAAHSGLIDVWVLQQYEPHLLNEHLSGGRPWDVVIRAGSCVGRSVIAENVVIGRWATVGAANAVHPALIGARRRLPADQVVPAGAQLEPTRPRDLFGSTR